MLPHRAAVLYSACGSLFVSNFETSAIYVHDCISHESVLHTYSFALLSVPTSFFQPNFIGNISADGTTISGFVPECGLTSDVSGFTAVVDGFHNA